ncbi:MAG: hypothetical protein KAT04_14535 [Methylococcales bacterium]|nr:hypothetical protein [Methylococcales bacterium]
MSEIFKTGTKDGDALLNNKDHSVSASCSNDLLCDLNEAKRVIEEQKKKIEMMLEKELYVIESITKAFGKAPLGCDGMLFVPIDDYNYIVETINT